MEEIGRLEAEGGVRAAGEGGRAEEGDGALARASGTLAPQIEGRVRMEGRVTEREAPAFVCFCPLFTKAEGTASVHFWEAQEYEVVGCLVSNCRQ